MPDHPGTFLQLVFILIAFIALVVFGLRGFPNTNPAPIPASEFESV